MHPPFVEDELIYKRATITKAEALINQETLDALLAEGAYDEILSRLDKLAKDNNLLWRRVSSSGSAKLTDP